MKKKMIPLLLVMSVLMSLSAIGFTYASSKPVIVVQVKGTLGADVALQGIMNNISYIDWTLVTGDLTTDDLNNAVMLISVLSDKALSYSDTEIAIIKSWLDEGGKTIWLCGDSDYGTDYLRIDNQNALLEELGSVLRVDHCATEDPVSNGGGSYRVLSVTDNIAEEFDFLAVGIDRALTHSPGVLTAYSNDRYWALSKEQPENVYVLLTTTEAGQVYDHNPPEPISVEVGDEGNFVTMAVEVDWEMRNMIILESEAPFGSYMPMYYPEVIRPDRYGESTNPQQGGQFFKNIINYVATTSGLRYDLLDEISDVTEDFTSEIGTLTSNVNTLEGKVATLESDKSSLEGDISSLQSEKSSLESTVSALESDVTNLESSVSELEADVDAAKSSASSWQMYAVIALILGAVIGFFVGPMIRK
jgi:outer membrane murein-binding lipoprotein Lpp